MYSELPTTGAVKKKDRITLPKAVQKMNDRSAIGAVQEAGRKSTREAKRKAAEAVNNEEDDEIYDVIKVEAPVRKRTRRG